MTSSLLSGAKRVAQCGRGLSKTPTSLMIVTKNSWQSSSGISFSVVLCFREMFRFTKSVKEWLSQDPKNVIAVHCKGGKGRTGMMISVWLIESGYFNSAPVSSHLLSFHN